MSLRTRLAAPLVALLVAAVGACGGLRDVMTLATALQAEYHVPANVNVMNGTHLTITLQALPEKKVELDSAGRASFAKEVATFAKGHYPGAAKLHDVTVAFATVKTMGPVSITHTDAPYTWSVRELP